MKHHGISISGIDKAELTKILHDPLWNLDTRIKQGKANSLLALVVGLFTSIAILYVIARFVFLPVLAWVLG